MGNGTSRERRSHGVSTAVRTDYFRHASRFGFGCTPRPQAAIKSRRVPLVVELSHYRFRSFSVPRALRVRYLPPAAPLTTTASRKVSPASSSIPAPMYASLVFVACFLLRVAVSDNCTISKTGDTSEGCLYICMDPDNVADHTNASVCDAIQASDEGQDGVRFHRAVRRSSVPNGRCARARPSLLFWVLTGTVSHSNVALHPS